MLQRQYPTAEDAKCFSHHNNGPDDAAFGSNKIKVPEAAFLQRLQCEGIDLKAEGLTLRDMYAIVEHARLELSALYVKSEETGTNPNFCREIKAMHPNMYSYSASQKGTDITLDESAEFAGVFAATLDSITEVQARPIIKDPKKIECGRKDIPGQISLFPEEEKEDRAC